MNDVATPNITTETGRAHYTVLDGLRGTAALCIALYHITKIVFPSYMDNPFRHSFLAVDFFFVLSGFVIAHAYDGRMSGAGGCEKLTFKGFFLRRIIRLHPMVIVGMVFGVICFLADPFVGYGVFPYVEMPAYVIAFDFMASLLLLPTPRLPYNVGATHSLNTPAWSLLQEYIGSIIYGFFGHRIGNKGLLLICAAGFVALVLGAGNANTLGVGWGWGHYWMAPVRLIYPFTAGILLHRLKFHITMPYAYPVLSLILIAIFTSPTMSDHNWMMNLFFTTVIFPLAVCAATGHGSQGRVANALCRITGGISYPLYIIHMPFVNIFEHWVKNAQPEQATVKAVGFSLYAALIILAWLLAKFYDEPVRRHLMQRLRNS